MENLLVCFSGAFLVLIGVLSIFAKDFMWGITVWNNRNRGVVSERTDHWDVSTTIGGVMAILAGLFLTFLFFTNGL